MFQPVSRRGNGAGSTAQVNLAPMMDMVFILLIFFVVTTTFARDTGIHVERPQSVHSQSLDSGSLRHGCGSGNATQDIRLAQIGRIECRERRAHD